MTDRDNSRTNRRRLIGLLAVGIPAALLAKQKG